VRVLPLRAQKLPPASGDYLPLLLDALGAAVREVYLHRNVFPNSPGGWVCSRLSRRIKVNRAARKFRINPSIREMRRNVEQLGPAVRATGEKAVEMVGPAMKVRDFHFSEVTKF